MWRWISTALLLCDLTPAMAAEVGRDTLLSAEASIQWRGVGRVNLAGTGRVGMCTGTLIRPDVVLTAAHCVVNLKTGQLRPVGTIHFVAGWRQGKGTGHARARAVVVHPDWQNVRSPSDYKYFSDLALIRLDNPLGPESAKPFDVARLGPFADAKAFTLVGYRRDRAHALTYQDDCQRLKQFQSRFLLICSAVQGASGSPIFAISPDGPQLVAVLSAASPERPRPQLFTAVAYDAVQEMLERLD